MSTATLEQKTPFTVEQFHWLGEHNYIPQNERIELIDGELRKMSPIGPRHNYAMILLNRLASGCEGVAVSIQGPLLLDETNELYPDFLLLKGAAEDYRQRIPQPKDVWLVAEISDSTLRQDMGIKRTAYAAAGIVEYWIVDVNARALHCFLDPLDGVYTRHDSYSSGEISPAALPALRIDVAKLF